VSTLAAFFPTRNQKRNLGILGGLLVLQIALAVAFLIPWGQRPVEPERLLPTMQAAAVAELYIEDTTGNYVKLRRRGAEDWVLPETDDYPVTAVVADQLVEDMVELDNLRPVTKTQASHARLRVAGDDFERKVTATMEDGSTAVLYVGTAPLPRATHVRVEGDDRVFISDDLRHREVSLQPTYWVNTVYYSVDYSDVQKFTLVNPQGRFEFFLDDNGEWQMEGLGPEETFNPNNLISLITTVSTISLTAPLGNVEKPEYGLLDPQAVVLLETQDGAEDPPEEVTITIGADTQKPNRVVVKTSEAPWFIEANRFTVDRLINRTREEFIVRPTPTIPEIPVEEPAAEALESAAG